MPDDSTRLTIRVPRAVVRQLENHIGPRETLSAVVRRILLSAVADETDTTAQADTSDTSDTTALAATVHALQVQLAQMQSAIAALQAWQVTRQPEPTQLTGMTCQPETPGSLPHVVNPPALTLPANRTLGKLCPRGHDYQGTGQSLLRLPGRVCLACDKERAKARRQGRA
ncbi:MAG: hypothetical protein AB7R40_25320 [Nitrospiraceae bacterium]